MRTVTYGAACSLDGFIAAADGGLDWLHFSPDVQAHMAAYWPTIDTLLMGRHTWEGTARQAGTRASKRAKKVPSITTYVFSRTMKDPEQPGVHMVRENAGEFVRALKHQPGKGICVMGGGILGTSLLEAGVVDEVGFNMHPVLLGSGVPLFRPTDHRIALELIDSRRIDGGCVLTTYRVK